MVTGLIIALLLAIGINIFQALSFDTERECKKNWRAVANRRGNQRDAIDERYTRAREECARLLEVLDIAEQQRASSRREAASLYEKVEFEYKRAIKAERSITKAESATNHWHRRYDRLRSQMSRIVSAN